MEAKKHQMSSGNTGTSGSKGVDTKWKIPETDAFKENVDTSVFSGASTFSIGMVMRDHRGDFVAGKTMCLSAVGSVFEALGVRESLSWIQNQQLQGAKVMIESDSMLMVNAILSEKGNLLEVGDIVEDCKQKLRGLSRLSVSVIRKNAKR